MMILKQKWWKNITKIDGSLVSADIEWRIKEKNTYSDRPAHQGSVALGTVIKFDSLAYHDDKMLTQKPEMLEQCVRNGSMSLVEEKKERDVNNNNNNNSNKSNSNDNSCSNSNNSHNTNSSNDANKNTKDDCSNEKVIKKDI